MGQLGKYLRPLDEAQARQHCLTALPWTIEEANSHLWESVKPFWSPTGITHSGCNLFTLPQPYPSPSAAQPFYLRTSGLRLSKTLISLLADACHFKLQGKQSPGRDFLEELKDGCDMSLKLKGAVTYKWRCFSLSSSNPGRGKSSLYEGHRRCSSAAKAWRLLSVLLVFSITPLNRGLSTTPLATVHLVDLLLPKLHNHFTRERDS